MATQINLFDEIRTSRIIADELVIAEITAPLIVTERVESLTDLEVEAADTLSLVAGDDVEVTAADKFTVSSGGDASVESTAASAQMIGATTVLVQGATGAGLLATGGSATVSGAEAMMSATVADATVESAAADVNINGGVDVNIEAAAGDVDIDAQGITSDVNLDAGRSVLVGAGDSFEVTAVNTVSITSPLNTVTGDVRVTGTMGINGQPGAAPTASGGSIGAFSDPPTPAEMAALRTLVNNLLTANLNFGTNT